MGGPRRAAAGLGFSLLLGLACVPAMGEGSPEAVSAEPTPAPSAAGDAASGPSGPGAGASAAEGAFELRVDGRAPAAPSEALAAPAAPGHAERAGWTGDGERFAYCRAVTRGCDECRWVARDGTAASLEAGPGCSAGIEREQLDARLSADPAGPSAERWAWGGEVVWVVETRELEQGHAGQPRPMLKVGAQRREGGPVAWGLHVDPCQGCGLDQVCTGKAHLDALALSPDGREVVALVHQIDRDGGDAIRAERLDAERLARAALGRTR